MSEEASLQRWWSGLDEFTRHRVLRLRPTDLLPADVAAALRRRGVHVTRLAPAAGDSTDADVGGEADGGTWAQPEVLLDLLARVHDGRYLRDRP